MDAARRLSFAAQLARIERLGQTLANASDPSFLSEMQRVCDVLQAPRATHPPVITAWQAERQAIYDALLNASPETGPHANGRIACTTSHAVSQTPAREPYPLIPAGQPSGALTLPALPALHTEQLQGLGHGRSISWSILNWQPSAPSDTLGAAPADDLDAWRTWALSPPYGESPSALLEAVDIDPLVSGR